MCNINLSQIHSYVYSYILHCKLTLLATATGFQFVSATAAIPVTYLLHVTENIKPKLSIVIATKHTLDFRN